MENASKALLLAASVLIGVMVLALAVYLFTNFSDASNKIHQTIEENQISSFNAQFTKYDANENVTIHDVISIASLASQNNWYFEFEKRMAGGNDNYITVLCDGTAIEFGFDANKTEEQRKNEMKTKYNALISNDIQEINSRPDKKLPKYNVKVDISQTTRRVYKITCTKI